MASNITYRNDTLMIDGSINFVCNNEPCNGPFHDMAQMDKDSYNWQRSYRTEDGWAFEIHENPNNNSNNNGQCNMDYSNGCCDLIGETFGLCKQ